MRIIAQIVNEGFKVMKASNNLMLDSNHYTKNLNVVKNDNGTITYTKKGYGSITTSKPLSAVRLELILDELDISQTRLAEMIEVEQPTISRIITGKSKHSRYLPTIAEKLNISLNWLSGFDEENTSFSNINGDNLNIDGYSFLMINEYKDGATQHSVNDNMIILSASNIPAQIDQENVSFIQQPDRAMAPDIKANSIVIFDRSDKRISNGDLYVVQIMDSIFTRFLFNQPNGQILIRSKDSDFPDFNVSPNDGTLKIIGKVFMSMNNH